MTYLGFIEELKGLAEQDFAVFQRGLIFTKYEILGVRTPILRKLAKKYDKDFEIIFSFPDKYYETVFIKLAIAANLPYKQFLKYLDGCLALIENWALCDTFKGKYIRENKENFLSVLGKIFQTQKEFHQRYVLVVLLAEYLQQEYLGVIRSYICRADAKRYYIYMAVAWLVAEILVKAYDFGVELLKEGVLDKKTQNKAIQKALESYRLTKVQKEYLRSLKIK